jgi:glycosyltransferase involved in cell wall biosynthesis
VGRIISARDTGRLRRGDRGAQGDALRLRGGVSVDTRPACLVTGVVSPYRREPFRLLGERDRVEVVAFREAGPAVEGLVVHRTTQPGAVGLAGSGRYRAVVCGLGGRVALPGSYLAARRAGVPFVLWATIWAHPRSGAHALSYLPTRHLYRAADAVVTYGPHVTAYVAGHRGGDRGIFEAPQAASPHFREPVPAEAVAAARASAGAGKGMLLVLFVGRLETEKGVPVLLDAFRTASLGERAVLALAGEGPLAPLLEGQAGVRGLGRVPESELPALYAAADVLVLPSVPTRTFLEPWGLVVNEAMAQGTPVITSDAVGAAAGGLVRDGQTGLVVPAGDVRALAARLQVMAANRELRLRLGAAGHDEVARFTPDAWARGFERALMGVGAGRPTDLRPSPVRPPEAEQGGR